LESPSTSGTISASRSTTVITVISAPSISAAPTRRHQPERIQRPATGDGALPLHAGPPAPGGGGLV
jgi:hypothetical protein